MVYVDLRHSSRFNAANHSHRTAMAMGTQLATVTATGTLQAMAMEMGKLRQTWL